MEHVAPRNATEERVAELWREVLGLKDVGVFDNFFELGGHSVKAIQLFSRLVKLADGLTFDALYGHPTIALFCAHVFGAAAARSEVLVPLGRQESGRGTLVLLHPATCESITYRQIAGYLDHAVNVLACQAHGLFDRQVSLDTDLSQVAARYVRELLAQDGGDQLTLCGYSLSVHVAFEMAKQLAAAGRRVRRLVLVDNAAQDKATSSADIERRTHIVLVTAVERLLGIKVPCDETSSEDLAHDIFRRAGRENGSIQNITLPMLLRYIEVVRNMYRCVMEAPLKGKVECDIDYLATGGDDEARTAAASWAPWTEGQVRTQIVPGAHATVFVAPHLLTTARALLRAAGR